MPRSCSPEMMLVTRISHAAVPWQRIGSLRVPLLSALLLAACVSTPSRTAPPPPATDMSRYPSGDAAWERQAVPSTAGCRSMSAVSARVAWAGCQHGRVFRTIDGGASWSADSVPGASTLDFRGIKAFDANTAVIVSAGPAEEGQARMYRTVDGGHRWTLVWRDTTKGLFLDGVAFWDAHHGFTVSDPIDGHLVVLVTDDGGEHWTRMPASSIPAVLPGEAIFAASNTAFAVQGGANAWIATGGGAHGRVFRSIDRARTWTVTDTDMPGGPSSGLFGIAFADARNGLAVGGDYKIARGPTDVAFRSTDGGATWTRVTGARPDGVTQGIAFIPSSSPRVFIAVGARGTAFTSDFGATWSHGDTLTAWGVGFAGPKAGWVAGPQGYVARIRVPVATAP